MLSLRLEKQQQGFSLLEISIALAMFAFLAYGLANNVRVDRDYANYTQNRDLLNEAKLSVLAFVQSNGYMPCPDTTNNGSENRTGAACTGTDGRLPYRTLGMLYEDYWGSRLYYSVVTTADQAADVADNTLMASYFSSVGAPVFNLNTPPLNTGNVTGSLRICGENANACTAATPAADMVEEAAVAVILSFGNNGEYSWTQLGNAAMFSAREAENADRNNYFWLDTASYDTNTNFDDQLVWINGFDIKAAMLKSELGIAE